MTEAALPFATRLWFAWVCFFRVLFDGAFAGRVFAVRDRAPELPAASEVGSEERVAAAEKAAAERAAAEKVAAAERAASEKVAVAKAAVAKAAGEKPDAMAALQLLALLQREGRFIDFLEQDVAGFSDADVGAAARVVHEGCRKAIRGHAKISAVRSEEEGAAVTIEDGYDAHAVKLVGNVSGKPPYKGKLQHRGWRVRDLSVPVATSGHDATVVAPAEVEL